MMHNFLHVAFNSDPWYLFKTYTDIDKLTWSITLVFVLFLAGLGILSSSEVFHYLTYSGIAEVWSSWMLSVVKSIRNIWKWLVPSVPGVTSHQVIKMASEAIQNELLPVQLHLAFCMGMEISAAIHF